MMIVNSPIVNKVETSTARILNTEKRAEINTTKINNPIDKSTGLIILTIFTPTHLQQIAVLFLPSKVHQPLLALYQFLLV